MKIIGKEDDKDELDELGLHVTWTIPTLLPRVQILDAPSSWCLWEILIQIYWIHLFNNQIFLVLHYFLITRRR